MTIFRNSVGMAWRRSALNASLWDFFADARCIWATYGTKRHESIARRQLEAEIFGNPIKIAFPSRFIHYVECVGREGNRSRKSGESNALLEMRRSGRKVSRGVASATTRCVNVYEPTHSHQQQSRPIDCL